ncbi:hypothetical protein RG47T_5019 [Mucilaginibacter polytrichastri]|uniref:Uncharacterized protein n=1 Tax=Mucilaginibacter polytrichastri TaxID=1302689 RepID=A0A1Q6A699_9SPHI|nr:hypothetical protein RG47T_5019 [Mucilaginibacter polytrichastri]SFS70719.1 hypothetical protein SAMN04487890_10379 [Mucilaginibacter polytrichastri]
MFAKIHKKQIHNDSLSAFNKMMIIQLPTKLIDKLIKDIYECDCYLPTNKRY